MTTQQSIVFALTAIAATGTLLLAYVLGRISTRPAPHQHQHHHDYTAWTPRVTCARHDGETTMHISPTKWRQCVTCGMFQRQDADG